MPTIAGSPSAVQSAYTSAATMTAMMMPIIGSKPSLMAGCVPHFPTRRLPLNGPAQSHMSRALRSGARPKRLLRGKFVLPGLDREQRPLDLEPARVAPDAAAGV